MAITPNALMRQLQNRQSIGTSMGEFIKLPFNSMVNATAKVFRIPIKTPLKYAVQAYQAERYIPKYNVPVEHQDSPQTVIAWCVNNGHIGADPYPFAKVKDATTWQTGKYFEFSDVQLKYINKDYEVLSMEYLEGSIRAGKSVANLTRAANFFASGDHGLNFGAGAYSFTAAKRLMLDSEMGFGHTIFAGKTVSGQESMRITYPTLLYPYTQASINVLSLQNQSSAKKILGQSVDMVLLEELSALDSSTLWELRNRLVQSKHALIMVSSNPMMFRQDVYEYIMSWNGNNPNTEESNHKFHFERWTMDVNPLFQGVEGKKKWEEIAALYRHDDALMQEKIYGRRSIPKGLVLAQFDESRNVIDHLPDMNYVRMAAGLDIGYNDATSLNIIIYGHRTSDAKPIAIQVANFYHRVGKVCNLANFSTKDQSPQDICQAVINSWVIVRRALQRRYGSLVHTGEIYVDPSNLGERNLLRQMLDNYRIPETYGLEIWKADNNSKKNSHTVEKGKTGAEYGFSMLNRSLANQNFYFLADGVLDTGGQLGNRHTLDEVKTYSRNPKDGSLIMSGNGHLDAIHSLRYIHNMLVKELYPYEN